MTAAMLDSVVGLDRTDDNDNVTWLREALWRNDPDYALALSLVELEFTERMRETCAC